MGGAVSAGESNDDLVDNLLEADYIKTSIVERVFRAVDRADYLTPEFHENAYKDLAWKSGNLHLSAPCIYSEVMESLHLTSGLSFLNLGSGTGYLSTMVGLIIGPYGINHGIEIHEDVVQYANNKLNEFWTKSAALDEYEFCKPVFLRGNCLSINADERQYDRVYCGAACPENYENYMKNLVKVGGILVMPLNDQLLQVTRTSETAWEVKSGLPVSFASLVTDQSNPKEQISLPDSEPMLLQDICRLAIRCKLRANVEFQNPQLLKRITHKPKRPVKRKAIRRLVIPIFDDSDGDSSSMQEEHDRELGRTGLVYSIQRENAGRISAVIELARTVDMHRVRASMLCHTPQERQDEEDETETEQPQASSSAGDGEQSGRKIAKREKFDSGLGEELESGKGPSSDSDDDVSMEVETDSDEVADPGTALRMIEDQIAEIIDNSESESEHNPHSNIANKAKSLCSTNSYSYFMKRKIEMLPLPSKLKNYINYYREF